MQARVEGSADACTRKLIWRKRKRWGSGRKPKETALAKQGKSKKMMDHSVYRYINSKPNNLLMPPENLYDPFCTKEERERRTLALRGCVHAKRKKANKKDSQNETRFTK
jgi:hypothetical protein